MDNTAEDLRETLQGIAREFHQLDLEDCNTTEKAVCELLVDAGFMTVVENGLEDEDGAKWHEYRAI